MSGNRITLLGFAAAEALTHADGYGVPVNNGGAPGPADAARAADAGVVEAAYFDSPPLPVALVEGLDAQALAHIRSGSPHVDVESVPARPERVEGGWWVSMRIFVSDEDGAPVPGQRLGAVPHRRGARTTRTHAHTIGKALPRF
jgi:hypothetical protein